MKYCIVGLLLIDLTGCSTTRGAISNFDANGNPCETSVWSMKSPWDNKSVEFAGVCNSSAQGTSAVDIQAAALYMEGVTAGLKKILGSPAP